MMLYQRNMRCLNYSLIFAVLILIGICLHYRKSIYDEKIDSNKERYFEINKNDEKIDSNKERYFEINKTATHKPKPVIIVTYGRSGSTFLANMLRLNKDVFYIFEPLHFLKAGFKELHYLKGRAKSFDTYLTAAEFVIRKMMSCQFLAMPLEYWNGKFNTATIQGHQLCTFQRLYWMAQKQRYSEPDKFQDALKMLQKQCQNSTSIIIKTIRTPLFLLKNLLYDCEGLKVIHLIRDPRPTVESQNATLYHSKSPFKTFRDHARSHCTNVLCDVTTFEILKTYYPWRLTRVFLEDLAKNPINVMRSLFKFIEVDFSHEIGLKIQKMTTANASVRHRFMITKGNSMLLLSKWRVDFKFNFVKDVDSECDFLYSQLGYIPVSTVEMLQNISIPLHKTIRSNEPFNYLNIINFV